MGGTQQIHPCPTPRFTTPAPPIPFFFFSRFDLLGQMSDSHDANLLQSSAVLDTTRQAHVVADMITHFGTIFPYF